jgi:hypothetical protein
MRKLLVVGLMVLPLLAAGCSKGPAEAALKAADEAIAKVAPDAEKFVPDQFKTLTDAAAAAKKDELMGQWNVMAKDMPILVADWQKKFDELAASKKLPKTATPERIEELRGKLAEVNATWTKATDAFNAGDIKGALENGAGVKAAVDWMETTWAAIQPAKK